jgi:hypothetical protein
MIVKKAKEKREGYITHLLLLLIKGARKRKIY